MLNKKLIIGLFIWNIVLTGVVLFMILNFSNILKLAQGADDFEQRLNEDETMISEQFERFHNEIKDIMMVINYNADAREKSDISIIADFIAINDNVNKHVIAIEQLKNLIDGQTEVINRQGDAIKDIIGVLTNEGIIP